MMYLPTIFTCWILCHCKEALGYTEETRLFDDLFQGYNPKIRPVSHHTQVLNISFSLRLYQLIVINEKLEYLEVAAWITQIWTDSQLTWNASQYDGIKEINLPPDDI